MPTLGGLFLLSGEIGARIALVSSNEEDNEALHPLGNQEASATALALPRVCDSFLDDTLA